MISDRLDPGLARELACELDEGIVSYEGLFSPPGESWPESIISGN
jgi:hypothetical protein